MRYFVFSKLQESGVGDDENVNAKIARAFVEHPICGEAKRLFGNCVRR
jgi:hypothetical protein